MPQRAYVFTEDDRQKLLELYHRDRNYTANVQNRPPSVPSEFDDYYAPEVYIAKVPDAGIPARVGTVPGAATCDIYQLIPPEVGTGAITQVEALQKTVSNLSTTKVKPDSGTQLWVPVIRDKWGSWLAGAVPPKPGPGDPGGPVSSASCGDWNAISFQSNVCLILTVESATGACGCIDSTQTIKLFPQGNHIWESTDSFTTCNGSGLVRLDLSDQCNRMLTLIGVVPAASGPPTDYLMCADGCGLNALGNQIIEFSGGGPDVCSVWPNFCPGCPDGSSEIWLLWLPFGASECGPGLVNIGGMWALQLDPNVPCHWSQNRSITGVTLVIAAGGAATLTIGTGIVYTGMVDCTMNNTLTLSSSGGCDTAPATVVICPFGEATPCQPSSFTVRITCGSCDEPTPPGCCPYTPIPPVFLTLTTTALSPPPCTSDSAWAAGNYVLKYASDKPPVPGWIMDADPGGSAWYSTPQPLNGPCFSNNGQGTPPQQTYMYVKLTCDTFSPNFFIYMICSAIGEQAYFTIINFNCTIGTVSGTIGGNTFGCNSSPLPPGFIDCTNCPVQYDVTQGGDCSNVGTGTGSGGLLLGEIPTFRPTSTTLPLSDTRHSLMARPSFSLLPKPTATGPTRCKNLGEDTGKQVICQSCGGKVQLKVFQCSVFGECTIGKRTNELSCCDRQCEEYDPIDPSLSQSTSTLASITRVNL